MRRHAPPAHSSGPTSALFTRCRGAAATGAGSRGANASTSMSIRVGFEQPAATWPGAKQPTRARTSASVSHARLPDQAGAVVSGLAQLQHCDSVATSSVPGGASSGVAANPAGAAAGTALLACDKLALHLVAVVSVNSRPSDRSCGSRAGARVREQHARSGGDLRCDDAPAMPAITMTSVVSTWPGATPTCRRPAPSPPRLHVVVHLRTTARRQRAAVQDDLPSVRADRAVKGWKAPLAQFVLARPHRIDQSFGSFSTGLEVDSCLSRMPPHTGSTFHVPSSAACARRV